MLIEEDHVVGIEYRTPVETVIKRLQGLPTEAYITDGYGDWFFSVAREETPEEREDRIVNQREVTLSNIEYYERLISDLKEKLA